MMKRLFASVLMILVLAVAVPAKAAGPTLDHCNFSMTVDPNPDMSELLIFIGNQPGVYNRVLPYPQVGGWYPPINPPYPVTTFNTIDLCMLYHLPDGQYYAATKAFYYSGGVTKLSSEVAFILARGVVQAGPGTPGGLQIK